MKSSLIRALTVGAALLVPVGSVAVLGSGDAGAVTKLLGAGSNASLAGVGSITLAGITLNYTGTNSPTGRTISSTLKANVVATDASAGAKINSGAKVTLVGTGVTAGKNACVITINKAITLVFTSPNQLNGTVKPTSAQVTVTGCSTPTLNANIKAQIFTKNITIKLI